MAGPPPPKQSKFSTISGSGGFTLLHEVQVDWCLPNFKDIFLHTKRNLHLLDREHFEFIVEGLEEYPMTKWKLSLVVGPPPRNEAANHYRNIRRSEPADYPDDWLISLKFDLMTPVTDLDGLFVRMKCGLKRDSTIANDFPDGEMVELGGPSPSPWLKRLLPLCTVSGCAGVLCTDWFRGSLYLRPKFVFYTTNVRIPEKPTRTEDEELKRKLKDTSRGQLQSFLCREGSDKVTVFANDGTKFETHRDLLRARSPEFNKILTEDWKDGEKHYCLQLEYDPEVVAWMIHFIETSDLLPFAVIKDGEKNVSGDGDASNALPDLKALIRFAAKFELQDLLDYLDKIKIPQLCCEDPTLAATLNQMAIDFGLENSKEMIKMFMERKSNDRKGWFF